MTYFRHSHGHFYKGVPIYACIHEGSRLEGYRWWIAKKHKPSEPYGESSGHRFKTIEAAKQFIDEKVAAEAAAEKEC